MSAPKETLPKRTASAAASAERGTLGGALSPSTRQPTRAETVQPQSGSSVSSEPVIFTILGAEELKVFHPSGTNTGEYLQGLAKLFGGMTLKLARGEPATEVTLALNAGAKITLRIEGSHERGEVRRALSRLLLLGNDLLFQRAVAALPKPRRQSLAPAGVPGGGRGIAHNSASADNPVTPSAGYAGNGAGAPAGSTE